MKNDTNGQHSKKRPRCQIKPYDAAATKPALWVGKRTPPPRLKHSAALIYLRNCIGCFSVHLPGLKIIDITSRQGSPL